MDEKITSKVDDTSSFIENVKKPWVKMRDVYYERLKLYDMQWGGLDISDCVVATAPLGGPVAIALGDEKRKFDSVAQQAALKNKVRIHNSAGKFVSEIRWPYKGLIGMGWTSTEHLVVVIAEGKENVFLYDMYGECVSSFGIRDCPLVADVSIWSTGLVVRAAGTEPEYFALQNFSRPRFARLQPPPVPFKPSAMVPIPPDQSPSRSLQVLLASPGGSIYVISQGEPQEIVGTTRDERRFSEPILRMALSPSGVFLATVNAIGTLRVVMADFSTTILEFITRHTKPPLDLAWCGDESVLLYWEKILVMVGPLGEYVAFKYGDTSPRSLRLQTEIDGCRVVTDKKCEIIRRIPKATIDCFLHKGRHPAHLALSASIAYHNADIKADKFIRELKAPPKNEEGKAKSGKRNAMSESAVNTYGAARLKDAVLTCLEAALHTWSPSAQKVLLQAASYAKLFYDDTTGSLPAGGDMGSVPLRDDYVERCKWVRTLHAVRSKTVGYPLTFSQFEHLGLEVLVDRLVQRREHLLALKICDLTNLPQSKQNVLIHWACAKIANGIGETNTRALGEEIIRKLKICPGISFGKIASTAFKSGLKELATMVLEKEPRSADQVKLLLSMEQEERALLKAIESRDSDLINFVLLHLLQTRLPGGDAGKNPAGEEEKELQAGFFDILRRYPIVRSHLVAYYEGFTIDGINSSGRMALRALKRVFYELKMEQEAAKVKVVESYIRPEWKGRIDMLEIAEGLFKADPYAAIATKAQVRLLQIQRKCEMDYKKGFIDRSLNTTLEKLIRLGHTDRANRIRREFAVPDKRWWHIQVRGLSQEQDWGGLYSLATSRRSPPIGFVPFIESCVEMEAVTEAAKYISKLSTSNEKMEWFCSLSLYGEAAEVAHTDRNVEALRYISQRAKSKPSVKARIDEMLRELAR